MKKNIPDVIIQSVLLSMLTSVHDLNFNDSFTSETRFKNGDFFLKIYKCREKHGWFFFYNTGDVQMMTQSNSPTTHNS